MKFKLFQIRVTRGGDSYPGVSVSIDHDDGEPAQEGKTDSDGVFVFAGRKLGRVPVKLSAADARFDDSLHVDLSPFAEEATASPTSVRVSGVLEAVEEAGLKVSFEDKKAGKVIGKKNFRVQPTL